MSTLPDTDLIIFYDIPSAVPGKAWSPNTWKTRLVVTLLEADTFHTKSPGTS